MKTLFLLMLVQIALFANTSECESALNLFDESIKHEKPISDRLFMMTIAYCEDLPQYKQLLVVIMDMLDTAEMQTIMETF